MNNNLGLPMRISASYATGINYLNNDFHKHKVYEIFAIMESEANFHVENTIYHLKRGDILFVNSSEQHKFPNQKDMLFSRLTIVFDPDVFNGLSTPQTDILYCFHDHKPGENNVIHLNNREMIEFLNNADRIIHLYNQNAYGCDFLTLSHMIKILTILNQKRRGVDPFISDTIPPALKPILDYIDKHLDSDLTLESLSSALNMDKIHLNRILKQHTGLTIHKYVNLRRVSSAKVLLSAGYSATDTCFLAGFNDYTSFARIFKAATGVTPKEYKKR